MPARRRYPYSTRARCEEVAAARDAIPSDKQLAREEGISTAAVRRLMEEYRKRGKLSVPRVTPDEVAEAVMKEFGL